ncbi:MAG TPA: type III-A CRISPR-associated RAMP protein Csm5 [bacterium (Candidatus Stahlbacteria)]|nr:type III-A CRISPR-associated RAMP protein Csm5 [Candidatus Stahlbacteria bacterium]
MKITLEVLTPLHIGSGEEISPSEYFVDKDSGRLLRLNMNSLFSDPSFVSYRERFIAEASRQRYIGAILNAALLKKHPLYSVSLSGDAKSYIGTNKTIVKGFIKSGGKPYIPGSSLKGSILSALIWHTLKSNYSSHKAKINELLTRRPHNRKEENEIYSQLMKLSLSLITQDFKQGRFIQWLSISDGSFGTPEDALEISLARVKGARWGRELPVLYETIKPKQFFKMELKSVKSKFSETEILDISHKFYLKVLEKDSVSVDKKSYLLRLGQGSTAYSTSLLILAEELGVGGYRIHPPRTRKRIDGMAMGWVRVMVEQKAKTP